VNYDYLHPVLQIMPDAVLKLVIAVMAGGLAIMLAVKMITGLRKETNVTNETKTNVDEESPVVASGQGTISIQVSGKTLTRMFHHFLRWMDHMAGELDSLQAEVTNNTNVTQSAITLLQGLKSQLDAAIASGDMSQVQALSDQLGQNDVNLAAAISANTPTPAPDPNPQPTPAPQGRGR
jgi:hypothetical protein